MASTKIINVLRDDKLEEILSLIKETASKEIILVLPKKSRVLKNEGHFATLSSTAKKYDKKVSLLCSSPEINHLANKYDLGVLPAKKKKTRPILTRTVSQFQPEDPENDFNEQNPKDIGREEPSNDEDMKDDEDYTEEEESDHIQDEEEIGQYKVVTTAVRTKRASGSTKKLGVRKEEKPIDTLKSVWKKQSANIWTGLDFKKPLKDFRKKLVTILAIASVIILGTIIYVSVGSARIEIRPHKEALDMRLKILASDRYSSINSDLNRIPGQAFNIEKTATQTFNATGERDVAQKARGEIVVYNEFGSGPQVLIATTRFESKDGLIFRTLKSITVPGTKVENGKIVPGHVIVEVVADKPGPAYNINAASFTIPAFKERGDLVRYEKIYGRSDKPIKGGIIGKAKVVTDTDYADAKESLTNQINKDIEESLKLQTAGLKVINPTSILIQSPEASAKIDEAVDSFSMTVNGSIKTIGFKEEDAKDLIKSFIEKTKNLTVLTGKLIIQYEKPAVNDAGNVLEFYVAIKGNGYTPIDKDAIKSDLFGKNESEIKKYFENLEDINSARVILSPFWVNKVPKDPESVDLKIIYE